MILASCQVEGLRSPPSPPRQRRSRPGGLPSNCLETLMSRESQRPRIMDCVQQIMGYICMGIVACSFGLPGFQVVPFGVGSGFLVRDSSSHVRFFRWQSMDSNTCSQINCTETAYMSSTDTHQLRMYPMKPCSGGPEIDVSYSSQPHLRDSEPNLGSLYL